MTLLLSTASASVDGVVSVPWPREWATGALGVAQRIALRLSTVRGTWPGDRLFGLDWLNTGSGASAAEAFGALVYRQVGSVPGVVEVLRAEVVIVGDEWEIIVHALVLDSAGVIVSALLTADPTGYDAGAWAILISPWVDPIFPSCP